MKKIFSIAIDGPSGAGKSTIAKLLAEKLKINYLDTGAMYRLLALFAKEKKIDIAEESQVEKLLQECKIEVKFDDRGNQINFLNDKLIEDEIRANDISPLASRISAYASVRNKMAMEQREITKKFSLVIDGRDIGTYVLPDADCKIYLTANSLQRAKRRVKQLSEKGEFYTVEQIQREIEARDFADSHRAIAPLKKADDAILIDSSDLTLDEVLNSIIEVVEEKINT